MAGRADNNEGSCKAIKSGRQAGKWRVQYTVVDEFGRKTRLSRIFPTQKEGKEFLRTLKKDERFAEAQVSRDLTLGAWFDWLVEHDWPESLDSKTIANRKSRFDRHVRPVWGYTALTKIDPLVVKGFYRRLINEGVGRPTVCAIKANLVRVFNQAISPYRRVPPTWGNPFALRVEEAQARTAVALTPAEARVALISPDLMPHERAMLGVFLLAGLRLSEQMALTAGQLDFEQGLIRVDRAVHLDDKGRQYLGLPKGGKCRAAVMCPELITLLKAVCEWLQPDSYLWPQATGNSPRQKKLVYATWRVVRKTAGLPEDMSPHDCRLTHINWIEKLLPRVSETTLKEHVGHAAEGVTQVNYTRPLLPAQEILAEDLEALIFPKKSESTELRRAS